MKKTLQICVFVLFAFSCGTISKQIYYWEGKQVPKRIYYKSLHKHTVDFIKNYPKKDDLEIFENLEVIYDTIKLPSYCFCNS